MKLFSSDKSLGGEIAGLDISKKLTDDQINFINESWNERLVLVFKKQNLDDPKLINFSKNFGELDPPGPNPYGITFLPEFPEINVISNVKNNSKAFKSGLRAGMIIVRVGQSEVSDLSVISNAIEKAKKQKRNALLMLVNFEGSDRFVAVEIF